jgi:aconitate hydratase 2/2-methylisocitrate dehydratase
MAQVESLKAQAGEVYRYMNFDQIAEFKEVADSVEV